MLGQADGCGEAASGWASPVLLVFCTLCCMNPDAAYIVFWMYEIYYVLIQAYLSQDWRSLR